LKDSASERLYDNGIVCEFAAGIIRATCPNCNHNTRTRAKDQNEKLHRDGLGCYNMKISAAL